MVKVELQFRTAKDMIGEYYAIDVQCIDQPARNNARVILGARLGKGVGHTSNVKSATPPVANGLLNTTGT